MSIRIRPEELGPELRRRARNMPKVINKGLNKAAHRGRSMLVKKTPVDMGQMKNSWRVIKTDIVNDAPHAGIIEEGARPHKVNAAGIASLTAWARRKLGVNEKEAKGIAFAIAKKLEKEGQKGHFIVRDSVDDLRRFAVNEVVREINKQANRRAK
jgi:hypothetical protein